MSSGLDRRLTALAAAVEIADARLDPERVQAARTVVERAGQRLGLGLDATVVALAGPTGAGKSTLFNTMAGAELVPSGRIRPTTSSPTAVVWGEGAEPLLDWLEVPLRHPGAGDHLKGLVLIDLPDFDSVRVEHRLEVDRMIALVDLMVWVVDPQKYADSSLHDRYLKPLAEHRDSMLVVLNQADTLDPDGLAACRSDLARVLAADGLERVPVVAVSARTQAGLEEFKGLLRERVSRRQATLERLSADVSVVVNGLSESCGPSAARAVGEGGSERLVGSLEQAAGVPMVVRAVQRGHRHRGALATGWPFVRWVRRLRPDPLRRLRAGEAGNADVRTSLPSATPAQKSLVSSAIRTLASGASEGMASPWPSLARSAAVSHEDELPVALDRVVAGTDLGMRAPRWWKLASLLQVLLVAVVAAGALWLLARAALSYLQLAELVPIPRVEGFAVPTLMLIGGVIAGLVLSFAARIANRVGARRRAARARTKLRERIRQVAADLVLDPLRTELEAHDLFCARLSEAAQPDKPRGLRSGLDRVLSRSGARG
ncbi:MAG: 50S ribosome-binding GTPase [Actinomycetota bacterium]|nr:50S ribosome-binding GTPase [Actinomycetota bacterium]